MWNVQSLRLIYRYVWFCIHFEMAVVVVWPLVVAHWCTTYSLICIFNLIIISMIKKKGSLAYWQKFLYFKLVFAKFVLITSFYIEYLGREVAWSVLLVGVDGVAVVVGESLWSVTAYKTLRSQLMVCSTSCLRFLSVGSYSESQMFFHK